jgi:hypothetical protein
VDSTNVLREAIFTIPVPAAPPRLSLEGAAVGLGFLDAALRLNHVRRLTERLTITQHRIAHRTTEVDVSINMLTDSQLEAARMFQMLTSHSSEQPPPGSHVPSTIWVPVARLSRTKVGPVEVHDAAGNRLPRLTQYETSRLIASGLYRLLRGILVTHPDARKDDTDLGMFLYRVHEPRWLFQSAILAVLTEASKPQETAGVPVQPKLFTESEVDSHRRLALRILEQFQPLLGDYLRLFDVAVNDHIVVVALDGQEDEHLLTYEAPLYLNKPDRWTARVARLVRANRDGYFVHYKTDVPTTLRSYHLVAESAEGIDVDSIFLSTNADKKKVSALARDLDLLAARLDTARHHDDSGETGRVLELELQVLLGQLSELVRRRRWEASAAHVPEPQGCLAASIELVKLREQSQSNQQGPAGTGLLVTDRRLSAETLRRSAKELNDYQLGRDFTIETHPVTARAHAYWRRPPLKLTSGGRTEILAGMVLRNTAETSTRTVVVYALAMTGIAYLLACFITRAIWPFGPPKNHAYSMIANREAIIAVLLLILGFLYTRLSLPERRSVAGHLRTVPRLVAYICIISTVALAVAIAAGATGPVTQLMFIAAIAVPVASTLLLVLLGSRSSDQAQTLARLHAPLWLTHEQAAKERRVVPDVEFSSTGDST